MKTRTKLRGFTLIECIVAMALIGIASLLMAQVYGSVAMINKNNSRLNTSLVEQMKIAEKEADTGSTSVTVVKTDATGANRKDGISFEVKDSDTYVGSSYNNSTVSSKFDIELTGSKKAGCTIYVMKPADTTSTDDGRSYGMDTSVRYKFILPEHATEG